MNVTIRDRWAEEEVVRLVGAREDYVYVESGALIEHPEFLQHMARSLCGLANHLSVFSIFAAGSPLNASCRTVLASFCSVVSHPSAFAAPLVWGEWRGAPFTSRWGAYFVPSSANCRPRL